MTVGELIRLLSRFESEMPVVVTERDWTIQDITVVIQADRGVEIVLASEPHEEVV